VTRVIRVDPERPDAASIADAADCLRSGGLVAFPTETVYGLGALALNPDIVRRIFAAKGRPSHDPLIVHVTGFDRLAALTRTLPPAARRLADRFWPGPLTLVLERSGTVPDEVTAGLDTVAIRIPSHPAARALLAAVDRPIAAPSANLFSRPSPTTAAHVLEDLDGRIDIVLDAGETQVGLESTVLDLAHGTPTVLRPGAITLDDLRPLLPDVVARQPRSIDASAAMPSPGMLDKHYAPRAPLTLYEGDSEQALGALVAEAAAAIERGARVGVLAPRAELERIRHLVPPAAFEDLGDGRDLAQVAHRLYARLRSLDAIGVDFILARGVPAEDGLGSAIRDRLRRASAGRIVSAGGP
jgi:L-threonylcarbamoyladenylate synthase